MKSLALFFLIVGIVMVTIGYMEHKLKNDEDNKVIEYRFVPRTILDDQIYKSDLKSNFASMFDKEDTYLYSNLV